MKKAKYLQENLLWCYGMITKESSIENNFTTNFTSGTFHFCLKHFHLNNRIYFYHCSMKVGICLFCLFCYFNRFLPCVFHSAQWYFGIIFFPNLLPFQCRHWVVTGGSYLKKRGSYFNPLDRNLSFSDRNLSLQLHTWRNNLSHFWEFLSEIETPGKQ